MEKLWVYKKILLLIQGNDHTYHHSLFNCRNKHYFDHLIQQLNYDYYDYYFYFVSKYDRYSPNLPRKDNKTHVYKHMSYDYILSISQLHFYIFCIVYNVDCFRKSLPHCYHKFLDAKETYISHNMFSHTYHMSD